MIVMLTWRRGSRILFEKTRRLEVPLDSLVKRLEAKPPPRIAGTAVFLTSDPDSTPTALLHSLKHFKVLHENNVIVTLVMDADSRASPDEGAHDGRAHLGVLPAHDRALRLHRDAQPAAHAFAHKDDAFTLTS